ncbi:GyrI-like domain-containing protein [Qiania dongpingensis]|uniref:GyrI-like domain-containing protein n=1 Tax=Qiania dongpingensis TaxID=2763669 RepID=A0A7G9G0P9_9FIRM|nr:GyrI-like domain-containing protein [Qiania dongpingensis]QNM04381.1 GyrI-like domain-containing protein [Qiania dongpingensis]
MDKTDYKKIYMELYLPGRSPVLVNVPPIPFIMIDGQGNPNDADGEYAQAVSLLYALSYAIKMNKTGDHVPEGYFEYVIPPLEGLWSFRGTKEAFSGDKSEFMWTSMMRQPDFVTPSVFSQACSAVQSKKGLDTSKARLCTWEEGLCVQCMHLGPYDDEPATLQKIYDFLNSSGLLSDISSKRRHHELYLSDPRRAAPERMKTVLRLPVREASKQSDAL